MNDVKFFQNWHIGSGTPGSNNNDDDDDDNDNYNNDTNTMNNSHWDTEQPLKTKKNKEYEEDNCITKYRDQHALT